MKKAINRMKKNLAHVAIEERIENAMLKEHLKRIKNNLDALGIE